MRENELYTQLESSKKRIAMIYRQMVFLDTRLQAFETVIKSGSTWYERLFNTESIMQKVDAYQMVLLNKHDEDVKTMAEERMKPKIQIVPSGTLNGR